MESEVWTEPHTFHNVVVQAGKLVDLQYADPYAAAIYGVQQQKWDAKQKRDANKQALTAARAHSAVASM